MTDAHDQDREPPLAREDVEDPQPSSDETSQHSQEKAEAKEQTPVEKVESKHSVNNVASIPNGGLKAWLQVLGAFFLFFNTWGILNTFGAYQTFYENSELFQTTSSNISWIGAVQSFLLLLVGAVTGPIYDAGHFRALLLTGAFLIVFGHMMLSICNAFWQAVLAQGIVVGIGSGCLFVPSVAIISTYFTTRIATAMGLAASGSSLGGIIYPIVFHRLQPTIGFAWTTRTIGFMMLAMLAIPISVMKMRVKPAATRKLYDLHAFKEPAWVCYVFGGILAFMGLYVPFFYIGYYSIVEGITDANLGFYLLPILNATSTFGRIIPNIIADKVGPLNMLIPVAGISGILCLCLIAAKSIGGVVAIAAIYGFTTGGFVSLPPTIFVHLSPSRGVIGTRMGMGFSIVGLGVLIGTPAAGAILGPDNDFKSGWIFGGVTVLAGTGFFVLARMFQSGWTLIKKV